MIKLVIQYFRAWRKLKEIKQRLQALEDHADEMLRQHKL